MPLSQGFANSWVHFYPANRPQASFRYLGQQPVQGHDTFVIAFAQIPSAVQSPGELRFEGHTYPILYQGIAWVEQSEFRIMRLRTDLLAPIEKASLQKLTAVIRFFED